MITKTKKANPTPEQILAMPVEIYHTLLGVLIGHVGKTTGNEIRLWAPAKLQMVSSTNVVFAPIAFITDYYDLHRPSVGGRSGVAEVIAKGYEGYAREFLKGSYSMTPPMVIQAAIETTDAAVKATTGRAPVLTPTRTEILVDADLKHAVDDANQQNDADLQMQDPGLGL